jgi:hypothetical protein
MNIAGMADDIPMQQALESLRTVPQCGNCPFAERDADDGLLYCREDSAKAQAVYYFKPPEPKRPVLTAAGAQPISAPELVVHGIITYWPEVRPEQSCWQHPERQRERQRLEGIGLGLQAAGPAK